MHAEDPGDSMQGADARVGLACLDVLVGGARQAGREEDALLGHVLVETPDADAVADGAALLEQPAVVIGQAGHVTNALPKMIISQPGLPGNNRS